MSQLYDLNTSNKDISELLDADGDIDYRKLLKCGPDGIEKTIDYMLDIYDRTSWGVFDRVFRHQGPALAWAYVLLDREYAVADVVRDTLPTDSGISFANYSVMYNPRYPNEHHSVGYLWIREKAELAGLADKSVLWAECWRVLSDVDADKHCVAILDPLPKDWSYHNENSEVFNMWHELKVHNARGGSSNETH